MTNCKIYQRIIATVVMLAAHGCSSSHAVKAEATGGQAMAGGGTGDVSHASHSTLGGANTTATNASGGRTALARRWH